jgi:hypothetical protein
MASGTVGVAVNVGGMIGVSVGWGVVVATGVSDAPQAVIRMESTTNGMISLERTIVLQS